jgi:hypothetical protein
MTDEHIIAYLLEELPEEESERFEDECFAAERWPDQINLVEEDLIDAYLRDELSPERRRRFQESYLATEAQRERIIMAKALLRHVEERRADAPTPDAVSQPRPTWAERLRAFWSGSGWPLHAAATIAVVVIIGGAVWLYVSRHRRPQTFDTLTLATIVGNRGDAAQSGKVKLPFERDALRIFLTLPERLSRAKSYRVELENEDGETMPLEIDGQDARAVSVLIPAARLTRGLYTLNLYGIQPDGTEVPISAAYRFSVE